MPFSEKSGSGKEVDRGEEGRVSSCCLDFELQQRNPLVHVSLVLEVWDQHSGRKKENHKQGGILETTTREGRWEIARMEATLKLQELLNV